MRELPLRPDLDQLRRQARDLRRGAAAGDEDALRRLGAVSAPATLSGAQLALAREHGFPSWARLKAAVERRLAGADLVVRPVASLEELTALVEAPRLPELARRFPEDRDLMLVAEWDGRIAGRLLACRRGLTVTPRAIAFEAGAPVEALLARLIDAVEVAARRLGAEEVQEGGVDASLRPLYERLGYRGRSPMRKPLLPLPGRAREAQLRRAGG